MLQTIAYTILVAVPTVAAALSVDYLLMLLGAATVAASRRSARRGEQTTVNEVAASDVISLSRICVVIPAHNEEMVLGAALAALREQQFPADRFRVVVIADNCVDATPEIGRAAGATVLVRHNKTERGKGYALAWAFEKLLSNPSSAAPQPGSNENSFASDADAFLIMDADTWLAPDFLARMGERFVALGRTDVAIQGRYGVLNSNEGWRATLMSGAFDLVNHVRPMGADALGLFVGLKGNGMLFGRDVLGRVQWSGHSITEDIDYSLDLAMRGIPVRYAPECLALAQMPTTAEQATSQRARWENGRYKLLRERFFPLLGVGLRTGNRRLLDAAVGFLVPPMAELAALLIGAAVLIAIGVGIGWLAEPMAWTGVVAVSLIGFVVYVLGGLRLSGAPPAVFAALAKAPFYALWKFVLYGRNLLSRGGTHGRGKHRAAQTVNAVNVGAASSDEWVRTARAPMTAPTVQNTSLVTEEIGAQAKL